MITLPKTLQTIFNIVATHLMSQMQRSYDDYGVTCYYRGRDGLKCAAGALIKDEEYTEDLENRSWDSLVQEEKVPECHSSAIRQLQVIHDMYEPPEWAEKLRKFAEARQLDLPDCLK